MNNKLILTVEDFSYREDNITKNNLKNIFYFKDEILLLNIKEYRKPKVFNKIMNHIKNNIKIVQSKHDILDNYSEFKKINLNKEFHFVENFQNYIYKNYNTYLGLNDKKVPTILHLSIKDFNINKYNNSFKNEIFEYFSILNNLKEKYLSIPIVLFSDNEHAPLMYTTIISILENGNNNTYYTFYILASSNFSKNFENQILDINNKFKCYIYFIYIQRKLYNKIIETQQKSLYNFFRLLIGDLLPKELNKCIYLDTDICVNKDLSELFNIDLKDNYLAGVLDPSYYFSSKKNDKILNLASIKYYINSGMLLINLKQIRKDNMTQKFIELSKKYLNLYDKDILNIACIGKIIILPPKYNLMISLLKTNNPLLGNLYKKEEIINAKESPYIIHFSGKKKPWNSIGLYMEKLWWDIAKKTQYRNLFSRENIYRNELKKFWYRKKNKLLDIDKPRSFNEKIQWLKLYDSTPIKTRLTDKYLVREWVSEKIGEEYLIPLLGAYDKFTDIKFEKLPNQFVIKCNHGSGYNIIVKDKSKLNLIRVKSIIESWMSENYAFISGLELQYRDIKPKIIIEQYMDDGTGDLRDYKFTCFNGKPYFIWVDRDRHSIHKRNLYDLNWNQLPYKVNLNYPPFPSPKKPKCLNKMIQLASILSKNFIYVRVDFYIINDKIYFGEMTFTSSSGTEEIITNNFEKRLSSLINLPKVVYNIDTGEFYNITK